MIRSGTNTLHGSLYAYNRNEALAALSPLQNPGSAKQAIRNNQFGFAAGGPILRNKTFFFLNGEAQIAMAANALLDTSPSAAWVAQGTALHEKSGVPVNPVTTNLLSFYPAESRTGPATTNNWLSQAQNLMGSPVITISGFDSVGKTAPLSRIDTTGHLTDNLSYTRGRHQLKFGGEVRRAVMDAGYFTNARGTFAFDGSRGPWASDRTLSGPLKGLADFLAGYPSNSNGASIIIGDPERTYLVNSGDGWAHDTFQATSELSLNFGVRYTYQGEAHDDRDSLLNFIPAKGFVPGPIYKNALLNFGNNIVDRLREIGHT